MSSNLVTRFSALRNHIHVQNLFPSLTLTIPLAGLLIANYAIVRASSTAFSGRYAFEFPLVAAYISLLLNLAVLLGARLLLRISNRIPGLWRSSSKDTTYAALSGCPDDDVQHEVIEPTTEISRHSITSWMFWQGYKTPASLVLVWVAQTWLRNYLLTYSERHNYERAEIGGFVLLLAYTVHSRGGIPPITIAAGLIFSFDVLLLLGGTNIRPHRALTLATFGSVVTNAAFPALLFKFLERIDNAQASVPTLIRKGWFTTRTTRDQEVLLAKLYYAWNVAFTVSVLSILALTPVVVFTKEVYYMWENYYSMCPPVPKLLTGIAVSISISLVASTALIQATGPLILGMLPVAKLSLQIWWTGLASGTEFVRLLMVVVAGTYFCITYKVEK